VTYFDANLGIFIQFSTIQSTYLLRKYANIPKIKKGHSVMLNDLFIKY